VREAPGIEAVQARERRVDPAGVEFLERVLGLREAHQLRPQAAGAPFLPLDAERAGEVRMWFGFWAASVGNDSLLMLHRFRYRAWVQHLTEAGIVPNVQAALRLIVIVDSISVDAVLDPECWPASEQLAAPNALLSASS
jgi:BetI-type transcriptional repressor, C-terminal